MFKLVAGVRYIYPRLLHLMVLAVPHCAFTMAFESVFPFFSRTELGMDSEKGLHI